jgi:hypothetical protein
LFLLLCVAWPTQARFVSADPVPPNANSGENFNRYAYASNNPYRYVDPDGRLPILAPVVVFVAKELASEAIEQTTGIPLPTAKNAGKAILRQVVRQGRDDAAAAGSRIAQNAAKGARAEDQIAEALGEKVAGRRVTLESTTTGRRSVTDIVEKDGTVHEVKTGNARLSRGQRDVQADIDAGLPVIPRGGNALKADLIPGKPTEMKCYQVDRC